jgi:hypothetical protein
VWRAALKIETRKNIRNVKMAYNSSDSCPTLPFKTRAAVAQVFAALSQHLSRLSLLAAPITRHIYHLSTVLL